MGAEKYRRISMANFCAEQLQIVENPFSAWVIRIGTTDASRPDNNLRPSIH
jgi:hypothetical protein